MNDVVLYKIIRKTSNKKISEQRKVQNTVCGLLAYM